MNVGGKKRRRYGRRSLVSIKVGPFLALFLYIEVDTPMYVEYREHLENWMAIQEKVKTPRKIFQANQTIVGGL